MEWKPLCTCRCGPNRHDAGHDITDKTRRDVSGTYRGNCIRYQDDSESFRENGVPVNEFYASGGISQKDPMTMQIYADVIDIPIKIAGTTQGPALGSAIFASVAAGKEKEAMIQYLRQQR